MPALFNEGSVSLGHLAMRPEISKQLEVVVFGLCECGLGEFAVNRDAYEFDLGILEGSDVVAELAKLTGADARERKRVKHDNHRLFTAEIGQTNGLAVLIYQFKLWCWITDN